MFCLVFAAFKHVFSSLTSIHSVVFVHQICVYTWFNCVSAGVSSRCVCFEGEMCTGLNLLFSCLYNLRFVCGNGGVKVKCFVCRWTGLMAFCPTERMRWWRPANFLPSWTLRKTRKIPTTLKTCRCTPAGTDDTPVLITHTVIIER